MKTTLRLSIALLIVATVAGIYIMSHGIGLIDGMPFGCGQYYYTDIPGWQRYFQANHYSGSTPMWILIALFFLWGWAMMRLWIWIEKRFQEK